MGTLEDVEGRVSYEATRLFHHVWLSEGQPLARADPAAFSPKVRAAAASSKGSGSVAGFLPCWLSRGINVTVFTQRGFVCGVGRAKL